MEARPPLTPSLSPQAGRGSRGRTVRTLAPLAGRGQGEGLIAAGTAIRVAVNEFLLTPRSATVGARRWRWWRAAETAVPRRRRWCARTSRRAYSPPRHAPGRAARTPPAPRRRAPAPRR